MKEKKPKPFEISIVGHDLALVIGTVVCNLYRKTSDIDHLCIDLDEYDVDAEDGSILRIFNNEDLARWVAGIAFEDSVRGLKPFVPEINGKTFREQYHWNAAYVMREEASPLEKEWWTDLQVSTLDEEWEHFGEDNDE